MWLQKEEAVRCWKKLGVILSKRKNIANCVNNQQFSLNHRTFWNEYSKTKANFPKEQGISLEWHPCIVTTLCQFNIWNLVIHSFPLGGRRCLTVWHSDALMASSAAVGYSLHTYIHYILYYVYIRMNSLIEDSVIFISTCIHINANFITS